MVRIHTRLVTCVRRLYVCMLLRAGPCRAGPLRDVDQRRLALRRAPVLGEASCRSCRGIAIDGEERDRWGGEAQRVDGALACALSATRFDNGGTPGRSLDPNMMGLGPAHQCSELMVSLRRVIETATDWGDVHAVAQMDVARAYKSFLHTETAEAMTR